MLGIKVSVKIYTIYFNNFNILLYCFHKRVVFKYIPSECFMCPILDLTYIMMQIIQVLTLISFSYIFLILFSLRLYFLSISVSLLLMFEPGHRGRDCILALALTPLI